MINQKFEDFWDECKTYNFELYYTRTNYYDAFSRNQVNGCGSKGGIDVPDNLIGMPLTTVCNIHDTEWFFAKNYFDLVDANQRFRRNTEKLIDKYSANKLIAWLRMKLLHHYYDAIKFIGTPIYAKEKGFEKV